MGLENIDDKKLQIVILSNMSQVYINLGLYEDALIYANMALKLDLNHVKSLFRKAKSLAFLFNFYEATQIFK